LFTGSARCYHGEEAAMAAIMAGEVEKGDVVVVRYEGPKGGPGMREMLSVTSAINGLGLSQDVALITDGRFSGGSHGFVIGHVTPEAFEGGAIALIEDGDKITVDAREHEISVDVDQATLDERLKAWVKPTPYAERGALAKYAKLVSSARFGAVTDA
jgi:dihydroxy-acid dehydratase